MKRFWIPALLLALILFVTASCSKAPSIENGKIKITVTVFPEYDFARAIGGDKVDVTMLSNGDIHSYEPTLSDIKKIEDSDIFIYIGGESYSWVEGILGRIDEKVKTVRLFDCVDKLIETDEGIIEVTYETEHDQTYEHDHDHDHHDHDEIEYDEHIWMSVSNSSLICEKIAEVLSEKDPENEDYYKDNLSAYIEKLNGLDETFKEISEKSTDKPIIVADRFPFLYLCNEYSIKYYAAMSGCSAASDVSLSTILSLSDKIKEYNVDTVLYTDYSDSDVIDSVVKTLGDYKVSEKMLNSCQSVTKRDIENGVTYIDIMTENAEVLREALD